MKTELAVLIFALAFSHAAQASGTKVGNGDDGADLDGAASPEGGQEIVDGPIFDARKKAVALLRKLNTEGVAGLGTLIPEVEKAPLYLAKRDVQARITEDQGAFHSDMRGLVFARTFAEPHSPTRFFPVAEELDTNQLIALHIHEGLHRALPEKVREDESVVASITLAITSPGSNFDRVKQVASRVVPEDRSQVSRSAAGEGATEETGELSSVSASASTLTEKYPLPKNASIRLPSTLAYTYTNFSSPQQTIGVPIESMHSVRTFLYPFGNDRVPLGFGIEGSLLKTKQGSEMGPLGLSGRMRLWSSRGFDVGGWANASLNTLSSDELKNSLYGRDVWSAGLSARKDLTRAFFEGSIGLTAPSSVHQKIGMTDYTYKFGSMVSTEIRAGTQLSHIRLGGFTELLLSNYFKTESEAYQFDSGRYRILSAGPEVGWVDQDFSVLLHGRYILNATRGASYQYLGDVLGRGASQGSLSLTASYFF
jgi:hypothetical protein